MNRRSVLAVVAAGPAVALAAVTAFGATTGFSTRRAAAPVAHTVTAPAPRVVTLYVDDPPAAAPAASSTGAMDVSAPAPAAVATSPPVAVRPASAQRAPVSDSHASSNVEPFRAPSPSNTTPPLESDPPVVDHPAPTTPTTSANPAQCAASDDGLTEAQKQARETACHSSER